MAIAAGLNGSGNLRFPVPPFRVRVVEKRNSRPVPTGVTGECQIRRRGLVPHYWKDEGDSQGREPATAGFARLGQHETSNRNQATQQRLFAFDRDLLHRPTAD